MECHAHRKSTASVKNYLLPVRAVMTKHAGHDRATDKVLPSVQSTPPEQLCTVVVALVAQSVSLEQLCTMVAALVA